MFKIFDKPRRGDTYAVTTGEYVGRFFTIVGTSKGKIDFLIVPDQENVSLTKEEFDNAKKECIIDFVEKLPKNILRVLEAKFAENKKTSQT